MTRTLLVLALGGVVGSVPAYGHHSFAAYYHEDQTVSVEGHVVELEYRNPHAWLHFMARTKTAGSRRSARNGPARIA